MSKIRIGVDIDGVMYKWIKTAHYMLRDVMPDSPYKGKKNGLLAGHENQVTHFNWTKENVAPEHWRWLWDEGVKLGLFRYGHLYPGTIVAMRELAEIGELVIITHRPVSAVSDTLAWLSFLDLPFAGVHILTNQEPKSSVHPQCDIYIDDKPENVEDLAVHTHAEMVVMPDRPWNQHFKEPSPFCGSEVRVVYSWQEFIDLARMVSDGN